MANTMRIGTHGRSLARASIPSVARIHALMRIEGLVPVVDSSLAAQMAMAGVPVEPGTEVVDNPALAGIDLFFSLGGDGTILDTVAKTGQSGIPVLGINLGRLGFLSSTREEGALAAIQAVKEGRYTIQERSLIALQGTDLANGETLIGLNEMSVHKRDTSSMLVVDAWVNDRFLSTFWSDGLIVATPTGSTAYSLSCGGPILDPSCDAMVITPISPHNLNVRPIVVTGASILRLHAEAREDKYLVNIDSRGFIVGRSLDLHVRKAAHRARFVQLEGTGFFNTLREKLGWGMDVRSAKMSER